ncbi:MAG: AmmeMemoRadiSam system protein A [Atopobiaceae bacterium]|nr:AmmeMemoRadiSam system protein A [Atopobiaceae bacterium]
MAIVGAFAMPHPPLIIPAVGRGREHDIQATVDACEEVGRRIAALTPDTVVISSPHATLYRDYFHISPGKTARGSFSMYGAPQASYKATYDTELVRAICAECKAEGVEAGTDYERDARLDHGTMIALHFIEHHVRGFRVVRMGLSGFSPAEHYRLGRCVQVAAAHLGRRVVWLASGDLAHKLLDEGPYGFAPEAPVFDERVTRDFATGDLVDLLAMDPSLAERAAECGLRSFQMMSGALDRTAVRSELLSYEGPFGVGYGVAAFEPASEEGADESCDRLASYLDLRAADLARRKEHEDAHVRLARLSLESYVRHGRRLSVPADLPADVRSDAELMGTRAGCFVSLKVDGALRGCIGTIAPTRASLAEEICANAISAGTRDPRFPAVRERELDDLVYDVDVLTAPEPIDSVAQLDPARYGVIVSCRDGRRGLLLPDLDGVDTVDEQVRIAAQKGQIDLDFDDYRLERFEVVRHL